MTTTTDHPYYCATCQHPDFCDCTITVGDWISIPAWQTEGMVIATDNTDDATYDNRPFRVLVDAMPDDPSPRWYRLRPGEFRATS